MKATENFTVTLWLIQAAKKGHDEAVSEEFGENYVSTKWATIHKKLSVAWESKFQPEN